MKQQPSLRPQRVAAVAIIALGSLGIAGAAAYGLHTGQESAAAYTQLVEETYGLSVTGLNTDDPDQGLWVDSTGAALACALLPVEQIRERQPLDCRSLEAVSVPAR